MFLHAPSTQVGFVVMTIGEFILKKKKKKRRHFLFNISSFWVDLLFLSTEHMKMTNFWKTAQEKIQMTLGISMALSIVINV